MATRKERYEFKTVYSRIGGLHRWRLFSFGVQVGTGTEKKVMDARVASRVCKAQYIQELQELKAGAHDLPQHRPAYGRSFPLAHSATATR